MQETQEMQVQSLGGEDALVYEMATHSSTLAWEIPWTEGTWSATVHGVAKSQAMTKHAHNYHVVRGSWSLPDFKWWIRIDLNHDHILPFCRGLV